jgi:hypothetical protein
VSLLSARCRGCGARVEQPGPEGSAPAAWRASMDAFLAELRRLGWGWREGFRYCGACLARLDAGAGKVSR